jgi:hypothetical protein
MDNEVIEKSPNLFVVKTKEKEYGFFTTYQGALAFLEVIQERKPNGKINH